MGGSAGSTRLCHTARCARSAPQQDVLVPEGIGPLEVVTQVRASGDNVRYAILAPTSPALFTIDESERGGRVPMAALSPPLCLAQGCATSCSDG